MRGNTNLLTVKILRDERINPPLNGAMRDENTEVYELSDYKPEDENTHHAGGSQGHGMDEDEEEEGGYHKTVQCANQ